MMLLHDELAIQKLMAERNAETPEEKPILYRIGVNLGDVLIDDDDILGEGVNIVARLESICDPGGVFVSGSAFDHVRGRIDASFVEIDERQLKNIARPVQVHSVRLDFQSQASFAAAPVRVQQEPPRLSIAVLPFANMSGDPEQEYFVDGLTESLITDLSGIDASFVVGRHIVAALKGQHAESNVRYLLGGSIQHDGHRMRFNVQLIDAESGKHLWVDRFDKPMANLFDMQDETVARLANAIALPLIAAEAQRAQRKSRPESTDLAFQGWAILHSDVSLDALAAARDLFEEGLALNRADVGGLVGVAAVDLRVALNFLQDDRIARLAAAEAALVEALALDGKSAIRHLLLGVVQMHTNRAPEGVRQCERALQLNRNLASAHALIANGKILLGRAEETELHIHEALRLSPHDIFSNVWCTIAGIANLHLGREDAAAAWLNRSINTNRTEPTSHFCLAAALAHLNRPGEARAAARIGLAMNPTFTVARLREASLMDFPTGALGHERLLDGLRKAGLPDG